MMMNRNDDDDDDFVSYGNFCYFLAMVVVRIWATRQAEKCACSANPCWFVNHVIHGQCCHTRVELLLLFFSQMLGAWLCSQVGVDVRILVLEFWC